MIFTIVCTTWPSLMIRKCGWGEAATNWICLISRDTSISPSLCHVGTCTFVCTRNRWCSVIYSIKLRKRSPTTSLRWRCSRQGSWHRRTSQATRLAIFWSVSVKSCPIQQCPYRAPDYSVRLAVSPSVAVGMVNLWECQRGYHCKWHRKKPNVITVDRLGIFRYSYSLPDSTLLPLESLLILILSDTFTLQIVFTTEFTCWTETGGFPVGEIKRPHAMCMIGDKEMIIGEENTDLAKRIIFL